MALPNEHQTLPCHVLALPYPGRGHINPMLNLCTAVAEKSGDIIITIILTEEWLGLMSSAAAGKLPNIRFATIPNILPSELVRGNDIPGFWEAVMTKMEEPIESFLDRLPFPPAVMIADMLPWAADVAARKNIQLVSLWPMSASVFTLIYHFDLLAQNGHFPLKLSENGDDIVDYIPGLSPIRVADVPKMLMDEQIAPLLVKLVPKAKFIAFTSLYGIEAQVIDAIKQTTNFSIYNIGPADSYSKIKNINSTKFTSHDKDNEYLKWLDLQPSGSVLYISLGSFLSVSTAQRDEIYAGLCKSGVRFLWVERGETLKLDEICGANGLIVPWCNQLRVLCHKSVGGFWSHCGWNSTKEAVLAGMPMLTFPILMDQQLNAKMIVEDWRVGLRVKDFNEVNIVTRDEIAEIVGRFMEFQSEEREEVSINVREMQRICEKEFEDGQSFQTNVDDFTKLILQLSSSEL